MKRQRNPERRTASTHPEADEKFLEELQVLIFKYPIAIQAAFSALVAEGRRFAETLEGRERLERLAAAKSLGRGRMLWEVLSMSAFTERHTGPLPSLFVDKLVRALQSSRLESLLSRVFERRFGG
jgi:hypothetical protein